MGTAARTIAQPVPHRSDLEAIGHGVELRVLRWLRRRGLLAADDAEPCQDGSLTDALDACLQGSLGVGELSSLPGSRAEPGQVYAFERTLTGTLASRRARSARGFDIHAAVAVSARDCEGRERGEERLLFGSNWPVCTPDASLETVLQIVRAFFDQKGPGVSEKVFSANAVIAYAL